MLTGKISAPAGAERREGEKGRMPLPLVVLISGKTATTRCGFCSTRARSVVSLAPGGGSMAGDDRARVKARKSEMRWTFRVRGYEMVKMGSKMAARYKASTGLVNWAAMTERGCGTRDGGCCESDPRLTPSSCRSTHQIPGMPSIPHSNSFRKASGSGSWARKRK